MRNRLLAAALLCGLSSAALAANTGPAPVPLANIGGLGNGVSTALGNAANASGGMVTSNAPVFTGSLKVNTRVINTATDTASASTDYFLCITYTSTAAMAETLPAGVAGQTLLIKDCGGNAFTNNITITPAAGTIDGAATYVINSNYGSVGLTYVNGSWASN